MALAPLDFPPSPTVGQLYPDPPVTGQPTYKWDGAQWLAYRASGTPGLTVPAAPFDALAYNGMQVNGSMEVRIWGRPGEPPAAILLTAGYSQKQGQWRLPPRRLPR